MPSHKNLALMADVFLESANELIGKDKVKFHFVILYMLATSIELYLKAIITINHNKAEHTHELNNLAISASVIAPIFLKKLTHCLYWKSRYHEANKPEQQILYEEDNCAVDYDEVINYIETLKNNYLSVNE